MKCVGYDIAFQAKIATEFDLCRRQNRTEEDEEDKDDIDDDDDDEDDEHTGDVQTPGVKAGARKAPSQKRGRQRQEVDPGDSTDGDDDVAPVYIPRGTRSRPTMEVGDGNHENGGTGIVPPGTRRNGQNVHKKENVEVGRTSRPRVRPY
jgi:hypothetical protein